MKSTYKNILAAACLLCAGYTASAQKIEITNPKSAVINSRLDIAFSISASDLDLGCDGQLKLEFAVEGEGSRLLLPQVIYIGRIRNLYARRNELLSGQYALPPYHIENRVRANKTYKLDYVVSIPYYPWMEHANISMNEYLHNCSGDYQIGSRALVADINPLREVVKPTEWNPQPDVYRKMVCFMVPEVEQVKKRAALAELYIGYPVNVYEVRPAFGDNAMELLKADELMRSVTTNELITLNSLNITGYASPDGPYAGNERLAKNRSEGFKRYLINKYNAVSRDAKTNWIAEDWAGFREMVFKSDLPNRNEMMSIIDDDRLSPDAKDKALQAVEPWSEAYKVILENMYPKLRRIILTADYTVQNVNDERAKELIYTDPEMLSLSEMYRLANLYKPGSREYLDVYRIAAEQYPNDIIANNNAAAALMMIGDTESAKQYMQKLEDNINRAYINLGAYYYIEGDMQKAEHYFLLARAAGIEQADQNLRLMKGE